MNVMKIYAYCRISTNKQSIKLQQDNISREYPNAECYSEEYTGTKIERPQWQRLKKKALKESKTEEVTIVFYSVSRMSRNASEGVSEYMELYKAGITLVFLKEPYINTDVYKNSFKHIQNVGNEIADIYIQATNKVLEIIAAEQITKAFEQAEKEVKDLQQRTKEGMKASGAGEKISKAREGKKYITKKEVEAKKVILQHSKTFGGSLDDETCMKAAEISFATFYKYKKELKQEQAEKESKVKK